MQDIFQYEVLNPIINKKKPYVKKGILYIPILAKYKYFIEVAQNDNIGNRNYYILFSNEKFNINCRKCTRDAYGRLRLKLKGEIKDYIYKKCKVEKNCDINYIESTETYDVFSIS